MSLAALGAGAAGLAGGALGQIGGVLSAPRRAVWGALGLPEEGRQVLGQYAGMDPDATSTHLLGAGLEMAGDPLTYAMMGLGGVAGALAPGAEAAGEGLAAGSKLAPLREGFAAFHGLTPEETGWAGRLVGEPSQEPTALLRQLIGKDGAAAGEDFGTAQGLYDPVSRTAIDYAGGGPAMQRHELMHGLVQSAATTGNSAGLGPLARTAAWLKGPAMQAAAAGDVESPVFGSVRTGLGQVADETAAHAAEGRGLLDQAGNAAKFLFRSPGELLGAGAKRAGYIDDFARVNPWAGRAYNAIGYAPYAAGAGAVGGAGYLASRLESP